MAMAHNMNTAGEPLPEGSIAKRKANLSTAHQRTKMIAPAHSPRARIEAAATNSQRHYEKLKAQGIHRCPECWKISHRAVEFPTPTELGKHRRFKHNVLGRSHTAVRRREISQENQAKTGEVVSPENFQCPHCPRAFSKQHGLSIHISQAHKVSTETALTPSTSQELTNGNGRTQGVIQTESNGARNGHRNDAALAQTIAIAHVTGIIQNIILTTASEYDLPPRQFATRIVLALGERYSAER
jgi:hypothetical protein